MADCTIEDICDECGRCEVHDECVCGVDGRAEMAEVSILDGPIYNALGAIRSDRWDLNIADSGDHRR